MNGGALPLMLICAALGVALAFARLRTALIALGAFAGLAVLLTLAGLARSALDSIFIGLWLSVIATAALTFVPNRHADRLMLPAGLNAAGWAGALAAVSDRRGDLLVASALLLLFIPARWFRLRGHQIVIKVAASWMIAIASLSLFVSLVPTPGYKSDHME